MIDRSGQVWVSIQHGYEVVLVLRSVKSYADHTFHAVRILDADPSASLGYYSEQDMIQSWGEAMFDLFLTEAVEGDGDDLSPTRIV